MLNATRQAILDRLDDHQVVLDIGGWADPFERADWVLDFQPYETRGYYERAGWREPGQRPAERFSKDTWIARNICDYEPYPFADDQFDFVICSQTLEDIHNPMWVCSEMNRIAKAGYIGVPSRLEEQSWGVQGAFVGHGHHHWIVDIEGSHIEFSFKGHDIHSSPAFYFPDGFADGLMRTQRIQELWWEDSFSWAERPLMFPEDRHAYYAEFVNQVMPSRTATSQSLWSRARRKLGPRANRLRRTVRG